MLFTVYEKIIHVNNLLSSQYSLIIIWILKCVLIMEWPNITFTSYVRIEYMAIQHILVRTGSHNL